MEIDNGFSLENLEKDIKNIKALADSWADYSVEDVELTICLALEFYCEDHNLDVIEVVNKVQDAVINVNEVIGHFQHDEGEE